MKPVIHLYSLYFAKCMSANVNAAQLHYAQHLASCPAVLQLLPATIYMNQETLLTQGAHCPPDLDIITEAPTNNSIMCIYHAPFALNFDTILQYSQSGRVQPGIVSMVQLTYFPIQR